MLEYGMAWHTGGYMMWLLCHNPCCVCEQVHDQGRGRTITLRKQGLPDAVVWNPW
jgi:D-hexose-6-phosphate mutarotase